MSVSKQLFFVCILTIELRATTGWILFPTLSGLRCYHPVTHKPGPFLTWIKLRFQPVWVEPCMPQRATWRGFLQLTDIYLISSATANYYQYHLHSACSGNCVPTPHYISNYALLVLIGLVCSLFLHTHNIKLWLEIIYKRITVVIWRMHSYVRYVL